MRSEREPRIALHRPAAMQHGNDVWLEPPRLSHGNNRSGLSFGESAQDARGSENSTGNGEHDSALFKNRTRSIGVGLVVIGVAE